MRILECARLASLCTEEHLATRMHSPSLVSVRTSAPPLSSSSVPIYWLLMLCTDPACRAPRRITRTDLASDPWIPACLPLGERGAPVGRPAQPQPANRHVLRRAVAGIGCCAVAAHHALCYHFLFVAHDLMAGSTVSPYRPSGIGRACTRAEVEGGCGAALAGLWRPGLEQPTLSHPHFWLHLLSLTFRR